MSPYLSPSIKPDEHSFPWTSSIDFAVSSWPATQDSDIYRADDYDFPAVLDYPDLQVYTGDTNSVPSSTPSTATNDTEKDNKSKKRREQNRNAQRAYRERREKHVKSLLKQIDDMSKNHNRLSESYEALRQEASTLQDQVQTLQGQLESWARTPVVLLQFSKDAVAHAGIVPNPHHGQVHTAVPPQIRQLIPMLASDESSRGL
ncbi:hypothetical protein BJY04DRAFT_213641 [Aspergillus karnatakaensis]|uniref:bZIP transcription factor n=1 Tax=Aspergillus karnatakaensis TaxID=1810916 RepID=UPI003CCDDC00